MNSLYGIRQYSRGARMKLHVDTVNTHVISAIINVDQEGMDEDWNLHIYDLSGKPHFIPMKAGQMVFYESARCLHTRHGPMNGDMYANIFIHYSPAKDEWDYSWF